MYTKGNTDFTYHVFKDFNINFDEKSNTFGTVRLAQWITGGKEPDESKAKLEIRKITIKDGEEQTLKGYSFSTEEGPHELVEGMVDNGFGKTKALLKSLAKRDDFESTVKSINDNEEDDASGIVFDMRDYLVNINSDEEEE